jgi:hypothetical protein
MTATAGIALNKMRHSRSKRPSERLSKRLSKRLSGRLSGRPSERPSKYTERNLPMRLWLRETLQ